MDELETDWSTEAIVSRRDTFYAASQRAFVPYRTPLIFSRGERQYLWDEKGRKYVDLLGMNVCISVGHAHPVVTAAVQDQIHKLQHCTTMFYHPVPAHYAEELFVERKRCECQGHQNENERQEKNRIFVRDEEGVEGRQPEQRLYGREINFDGTHDPRRHRRDDNDAGDRFGAWM